MSHTAALLADVRAQLAPDDAVIKEARERDLVRSAAESFEGGLRSFRSGALAHGTANCPVHQRDKGLDADCGWCSTACAHAARAGLRDRGGPVDVVDEMRAHVAAEVKAKYEKATFKATKAPSWWLPCAFPGGEDPTVDLVVGLTRKDEPGLWIPNTEKDTWNPRTPRSTPRSRRRRRRSRTRTCSGDPGWRRRRTSGQPRRRCARRPRGMG